MKGMDGSEVGFLRVALSYFWDGDKQQGILWMNGGEGGDIGETN